MADPLLDAIVRAPDDDAPRLVWADREGGDRGELVVLQCRLARHDLSREERRRLATREAELLRKNTLAWAGVPHATFVRGFVERVTLPIDELVTRVEELFERAPLLHGLRIERLTEDVNLYAGPDPSQSWTGGARKLRDVLRRAPPDRLRVLDVSAHVYQSGDWAYAGDTHNYDAELLALLAEMPTLGALRELIMINTAVSTDQIPGLARLDLERLQLGSHRLGGAGVVELLRASPRLVRLAVWSGHPRLKGDELETILACPEVARLEELDLLGNELAVRDLEAIAASAGLSRLKRLGVGWSRPGGVRPLARSPHLANLRELDLYGMKEAERELEGATFAPSLRVLRLPLGAREKELLFLPALERIDAGG